ncbi:MAG TPA: Rieske (2Fe-2S) protein [Rhodobiaceae bacterium]|jgi:phenylpropionate dioxygenase-like ring-hydroxylating dioxygenase large terminal subunit|nr:Rieske (2Fe-2S) protein [Rhodobiaceae bacterium]
MKHEAQVEQLRKIFGYLDAGETAMGDAVYRHHVSDYTSPDQAGREREMLFRHEPLLIGLSCELPNPGDYVTDDFSGVPILVVRNEAGQVNAFINVCRHRGARVASGCGSGKTVFSCPYHAWTYDRSGRLRSIPFEQGFESVDKTSNGLRPLPVVEKYGMIWVMPTPGGSIDIDGHLAGMADDLVAFGLASYSHYETRVLRARLNWKLVIDTFLETYHLSTLHKNTIAPILHSNLGTFDGMARNLRMIGARKTIDALRQRPESEWDLVRHSALVYVLFPNTVFIMQGDHLETWRVYPGDSVDESKMHVSLYTPEPAVTDKARKYWAKNMDLLMATVQQEDFPLAENIQRDFHSGAQDFVTFGANEPALAYFHRSIKKTLGIDTA